MLSYLWACITGKAMLFMFRKPDGTVKNVLSPKAKRWFR